MYFVLGLIIIAFILVYFGIDRKRQEASIAKLWERLDEKGAQKVFEPAMADALPEPARRYLLRSITPGTPLAHSIRLHMTGSMRLKPGAELLPMSADQILAPPHGFIWKARVGRGLFQFAGFDRYAEGVGEMRWWLYGLLPIVKAKGPDLDRSAAGRLAGEAIFLASALLSPNGAQWVPESDTVAHYRMVIDTEPVTVSISVKPDGLLERVSIKRWRGDLEGKKSGYFRFDVDEFSDVKTFGGYTIQTKFRAGWELGLPSEFPFFYASIDSAEYH
ncbi:MAG TPA: hypothetical protein DCS07_09245 [Bdellovibrionales bacterium]|nr:MAG: hypothetical protein A2X97_12435 [Bdellovibrionales bacterium GWA1_52_35]HAR42795.1 hypothetical protein [Bdellovibrionales bacterium]HCM41655.1 hypothetical protein [Bdellovibrionales bacterium]